GARQVKNPTGSVRSKRDMTRSDPPPVAAGVLCGLLVGICAWVGLPYFGLEVSRAAANAFPLLGGAFGAWVLERDSELRLWCGLMAILVGVAGFIGGFFASVTYYGRSPEVKEFSMTVSGPSGAVVGAMLGAVIWALRRRRQYRRVGNPVWNRDLDILG